MKNGGLQISMTLRQAVQQHKTVKTKVLFAALALLIGAGSFLPSMLQAKTAKAAAGDLAITNVSPNSGPTTGGNQVVIDGDGFMKEVTLTQITMGYGHTCALGSDNKAYCWGGQLE